MKVSSAKLNAVVSIKHFRMDFGKKTVVKDLSFDIFKGEVFGFLGSNGSGKTTTIRALLGLYQPTDGELSINGEPFSVSSKIKLGYLPEERGLYKSMKVGEQCLYLAQLKGMSKQEAKKQLKYWFEKFEIETWWDKKLQELSKGMAQKVQFIVRSVLTPCG